MDATQQELALGETVCKKLKYIYHADKAWVACNKDIAAQFTKIKRIMYKLYPERARLDIIKEISTFDMIDFEDALSVELKDECQDNSQKYGDKVTWVPVPVDKPELLEAIRKMLV